MAQYEIVEDKRQVKQAMALLKKQLVAGAIAYQRRLYYPLAGAQTFRVYWRPKEKYWFYMEAGKKQFWCCYGIEDPAACPASHPLRITIQVNPSLKGANQLCAGSVLRKDKDFLYAHSGKLGGGGVATGKDFTKFLERDAEPCPDSADPKRIGFIIGKIASRELPALIGEYVYQAAAYRAQLKEELFSDPIAVEEIARRLERKASLPKPKGQDKPRKVMLNHTEVFKRDARVIAYVRRQAKGRCELCSRAAPFQAANGSWYLEVHHPRWLSQGGSDRVDNAVALCPNCHRALHHGSDAVKRLSKLYRKVKRLRAA